jgi:hypothetical protein
VGKFGDALRKKFKTPQALVEALGLDENLLSRENLMATNKAPSKFANFAMQLVANAVAPVLAKDAKIDLMPVFKDVTAKSFKAAPIKLALDSALKGKLAADAEVGMGHVASILDHIEHVAGEGRDESVSPEEHKAMEAAAHGESKLGIPKKVGEEFAKKDEGAGDKKFGWDEEKVEGFKKYMRDNGVSEDDVMGACDALGLGAARMPGASDEETEEEKKAREEKEAGEKKAAEDKRMADDAAKRMADDKKAAEDKRMADDKVSKHAMDQAIQKASTETAKRVRETERKIRIAMDEVRPWVGEFKPDMAFDSECDVYRQALTMRGVEGAEKMNVDATVLRSVLNALPKPGSEHRTTNDTAPNLGMDESAVSDVHKMFPGLDRIQAA